MATNKVNLWGYGQVWINKDLNAPNPTDINTNFDEAAGWFEVGILDGDAGFADTRSVDKADYFGWGRGVVRVSRKNFKLEKAFTALENNDVTWDLCWPGSSKSEIKVPEVQPIKIAFATRDGKTKERLITRNYAEVDPGDQTYGESDITKIPLTATIYADDDKVLFDRQWTDGTKIVPGPPTNEKQSVTITGAPTGGTFALSFGGATANIAQAATAAVATTALEALPTIGVGNVTVTGTGPYVVEFKGNLAATNVPLMTASAANLTGGTSPAVTVVQTVEGGPDAYTG